MASEGIELSKIFTAFKKIFKRKRTTSVGVDIGSSSIKIVELAKKGDEFFLKNYAIAKINKELIKSGGTGVIKDVAGIALKKVLTEAGIKSKEINISVPTFTSLVTTIELTASKKEDFNQLVRLEAPKYIPIPLEEVVYDWQFIGEGEEIHKDPTALKMTEKVAQNNVIMASEDKKNFLVKQKVLLIALTKEISRKYEEILTKQELEVKAVEIDAFSLLRSLVGADLGDYIIVDIGESICNIVVVSNGTIILCRSLDVAGAKITDVIARSLNIDLKKAEEMKCNQGLMIDEKLKTKVLALTLNIIIDEIKKSIFTIKEDYPELSLQSILLTGGSSRISGLSNAIEQAVNIKCVLVNPWSRVNYPKELEMVLKENSAFFSVAVGLAMRGFLEN